MSDLVTLEDDLAETDLALRQAINDGYSAADIEALVDRLKALLLAIGARRRALRGERS